MIRHVRPKYACRCCDVITQAPAPAMPTPRGVLPACSHICWCRNMPTSAALSAERDLRSRGARSRSFDLAIGSVRRSGCYSRSSRGSATCVCGREDPRRRYDRSGAGPGLGRTKTGRLWVYVRDDRPFCGNEPPAAVYFYSPDRGGENPAAHLAASPAFCTPMPIAGSRRLRSSGAAPRQRRQSPRSHAGPIAAARSSTCGRRRNRRSPKRRSTRSR